MLECFSGKFLLWLISNWFSTLHTYCNCVYLLPKKSLMYRTEERNIFIFVLWPNQFQNQDWQCLKATDLKRRYELTKTYLNLLKQTHSDLNYSRLICSSEIVVETCQHYWQIYVWAKLIKNNLFQIFPQWGDASASLRSCSCWTGNLTLLGDGPEHLLQGQAHRSTWGTHLYLWIPCRQGCQNVQQSVQKQIPHMYKNVCLWKVSSWLLITYNFYKFGHLF